MIRLRKSKDRYNTKIDWLDSKHTFSFGGNYDPEHLGFGKLMVINEDKVSPDRGFGTHPHRDMEIITYVLEGKLQHKDSLGSGSVMMPGDVQHMSAGTGILHSEFNPDKDKPLHFLQIWVLPDKKGYPPVYEQKNFSKKLKSGAMTLVASPNGQDESLTIHQDFKMYVLKLEPEQKFIYSPKPHRLTWIQVARGSALINQQKLEQGDGAAISDEKSLEFIGRENSEIVIFDLATIHDQN